MHARGFILGASRFPLLRRVHVRSSRRSRAERGREGSRYGGLLLFFRRLRLDLDARARLDGAVQMRSEQGRTSEYGACGT